MCVIDCHSSKFQDIPRSTREQYGAHFRPGFVDEVHLQLRPLIKVTITGANALAPKSPEVFSVAACTANGSNGESLVGNRSVSFEIFRGNCLLEPQFASYLRGTSTLILEIEPCILHGMRMSCNILEVEPFMAHCICNILDIIFAAFWNSNPPLQPAILDSALSILELQPSMLDGKCNFGFNLPFCT